jgi:hypothetical protein
MVKNTGSGWAIEIEGYSMKNPGRRFFYAVATAAVGCVALLSACTPTIRIEVAPINIYAKLDADVRVRLDKEVQSTIQQNPNLF